MGDEVNETQEQAKQEDPSAKPPTPPVRMRMEEPATLVVEMDLNRINPAWARGAFFNASDIAMTWYQEQAEAKAKARIVKPGMADGMKNFLRSKFR